MFRRLIKRFFSVLLCLSFLFNYAQASVIMNPTESPSHQEFISKQLLYNAEADSLNQRLSKINGKTDFNNLASAINEIYPNAVILDKTSLQNISSLIEIKELILNKNTETLKNIDEIYIEEDILPFVKTVSKSNIEELYLIIDYDSSTQVTTLSFVSFCGHCLTYVALYVIKTSLGLAINPAIMFLVEYFLNEMFCSVCDLLLDNIQTEEYIEPVPICGGCQQYFSWVNQNWYCYTCQVWN